MTNLEKYNHAFIDALNVEGIEFINLRYKGIPEWNSVGHMSLVTIIEDTFNIMLDPDDILDFDTYLKGKEILKKYGIEI